MLELLAIPLSALQHHIFCPRQCALIHLEQVWSDNWLTAQGNLLHQRVDQGEPEQRRGVRYERAVPVAAPALGITGKLDLVEVDLATGQCMPVEYKRGKPKQDQSDTVQLCAQALCLEEMTGQHIPQAAIWYWQTRHREPVVLDEALRKTTLATIAAVRNLLQQGQTPAPVDSKKCKACSLLDLCQPKLLATDSSQQYQQQLYQTD